MNKVFSHIYYIYITSPLLKKRFGYKLFAINLYFNSSQYYPTLDKTLAIKLSLHLQLWCAFHPFVIFTEHNTVMCINKMQNKSHILTRWGLMLQGYNLIIKHIKCNDSFIANVLSRVG
jgi:hypothetical protein